MSLEKILFFMYARKIKVVAMSGFISYIKGAHQLAGIVSFKEVNYWYYLHWILKRNQTLVLFHTFLTPYRVIILLFKKWKSSKTIEILFNLYHYLFSSRIFLAYSFTEHSYLPYSFLPTQFENIPWLLN